MKDFRNNVPPIHWNIGRHANFDDKRHWEFARIHTPRLHREEFEKGWTVDRIVFLVCVVLLALGLLAVNLKGAA